MSNLYLLAVLAFLVTLAQTGESLKCWVCSSDVDANCDEQFLKGPTSFDQVECKKEAGLSDYILYCKREVTKDANQKNVTTRSCVSISPTDKSGKCPESESGHNVEACIICNTDGCNGRSSASAIGNSLAFIVTALCIVLFK